MELDKVSVIIPTYNRFKYLLNAIKSVLNQTYKNIEIIVINDGSTDEYYKEYKFSDTIKIIHLEKNSREVFGFVCMAHVRNEGMKLATGKYIAFLDDDDIWLPNKLDVQINAMKETGCKMSSTNALTGKGMYNKNNNYTKYNYGLLKNTVLVEYCKKGGIDLVENGFSKRITLDFLKVHNFCICSSVIIEKTILDQINYMKCIKPPGEDYDCWLRALEHTDCVYIDDAHIYYDLGHGYGIAY